MRKVNKLSESNRKSDTGNIVAIGASAGGLDALARFFEKIPQDTGAAFVVIQHLSPDHKSIMSELLSRHSTMPVQMVEEDQDIQPNKIYIISPGVLMYIKGKRLSLKRKPTQTLAFPIDIFFSSLAQSHGGRAIGIVLSGAGTDGTLGAAAIHEAGGLILVQSPEDAEFDGMPRSLIGAGHVDAVMRVDQLCSLLVQKLSQKTAVTCSDTDIQDLPLINSGEETALSGIMHLLQSVGGIDFQDYKIGTVIRRLERRMEIKNAQSLSKYYDLASSDRSEVLALRKDLLISVTSFFRDPEAFESLRKKVIEPLVTSRQQKGVIRVWCAAISTGEEAYSIAMLFHQVFDKLQIYPDLKIFATDVDQANIDSASDGDYPESIEEHFKPHLLDRFFIKRGNRYLVKNEIRKRVVFAKHNVLADPPFSRVDLMICRNLLIYFKPVPQNKILKRLQYALSPGGHIFLGPSETLGAVQHDFKVVDQRNKIWQLVHPAKLTDYFASIVSTGGYSRNRVIEKLSVGKSNAADLGKAALLKAYSPPAAVLLDAQNLLVCSYGDAQRYLQHRPGNATLIITSILIDGLGAIVSALLFRASKNSGSVVSDSLVIDSPEGKSLKLKLTIRPAGEYAGTFLKLLVIEELKKDLALINEPHVDFEAVNAERLSSLEQELAASKERLQANLEELESSNEELQAINEELTSTNEELQSSNEELQSANEELNTINVEYQEKIMQLEKANADLDGMTIATAIGIIFLDNELNITRFSPDAARIFKLKNIDIGRSLSDISHDFIYPDLYEDLARILLSETQIQKEVASITGAKFYLRMISYRASITSKIGLVLSFVDISSLYEATRLQNIIDALAEHIVVLDKEGAITMVNTAWKTFAIENGDPKLEHTGIGVNYLTSCQNDDATEVHKGMLDVLQGRRKKFKMEYPCHSDDKERWFVMQATSIDGDKPGAVVSHVDITEWRLREALQK